MDFKNVSHSISACLKIVRIVAASLVHLSQPVYAVHDARVLVVWPRYPNHASVILSVGYHVFRSG